MNYTTASYKQYSDAYDAIVNSLEAATTVDALNSINVSELKAAAEAKLVKIPAEPEPKPEPETDAPETDAPETDAPETDAPETNAPEFETETESESDAIVVIKGCGGCNSTAAISAAIIVGMVGVALTTKKRRR